MEHSLQINYAEMLNRIEPLRSELKSLEQEAEQAKLKDEEVKKLIYDLEKSIAGYKEEYALLISQAQAIKADLESVASKVGYFGSLVVKRQIFVQLHLNFVKIL